MDPSMIQRRWVSVTALSDRSPGIRTKSKSLCEALRWALPGNSSILATDHPKRDELFERLTSPSWETAPGKNGTSYYRIQGPKLVIEYAPQPGEDHVHTIYRDPTNDYGADQQMKRILVPFSPVSSYR
jgi:uncharacterized protein DUF3500